MYPYEHFPLPFPDSTRVCALPDAPDPPDFDPSVSAMKIQRVRRYSDLYKKSTKKLHWDKSYDRKLLVRRSGASGMAQTRVESGSGRGQQKYRF